MRFSKAEFDSLSLEQSRLLELLDGEIIRRPSPTIQHQQSVFLVAHALHQYSADKGAVVSHDVEFALTGNTRLRPDVWVVLPPRAAEIDTSKVPIPGSPDLAAEVISPSEYAAMSMRKVDFYLDHGAREVWQIYPAAKEAVIYGPQGQMRRCRGDEALASWLLADLAIPVSRFFG